LELFWNRAPVAGFCLKVSGKKNIYWDFMGIYSDFMGIYNDLMGIYSDLMGFYGNLLGLIGFYWD
jgi:hypothetical protein